MSGPGSRAARGRAFAGISFALALIAILVWPAAGAAQDEPVGEPRGNVELILDSSGSMRTDDGTGQTKIEAAKSALDRLVAALPEGAPVGLRVFGGRERPTDRLRCLDTRLEVPVGPLDRDAMRAAIAAFTPDGKTPIALSLRKAARDLPDDREQVIVLVSDGKDSCAPPDPCRVAKNISARGVDLRVQAIGFQVDAEARRQLRCIARVTGGVYRDAADADSLADGLIAAVTRALRGYETSGEPVTGGSTRAAAPLISGGQYVDEIERGQTLWYAVEVPEGVGLAAAATVVPPLPRIPVSFESVGGRFALALVGPADEASATTETEPPGPVGSIDSEWEANFVRGLGAGDPVSVLVRSDGIAGEADPPGTYALAVTLEDPVNSVPDRTYPLELLVTEVGEPVTDEPAADAGPAGEQDDDDGAPTTAAVAVGFGAALLGFGAAAGAARRLRR